MTGQFFWYDLMTTDTGAAAKFYGDVVGWTAANSGTPGKNYTVFSAGGRGLAGLMPIPDEARQGGGTPFWMGYIHVDDVDAMVARIQQEGGHLHRDPETIPGVIRFAVVSDPHNAVFLVATPLSREKPPELAPGTPGTCGWRELFAGDGAADFDFYQRLFGWTKSRALDMGPMGAYQIFRYGEGDGEVGAMMNKPDQVPRPFWNFYINVPSVAACVEKVTGGGGKILMGPHEVPGGQWILQALDPQGAPFALVSPGQ